MGFRKLCDIGNFFVIVGGGQHGVVENIGLGYVDVQRLVYVASHIFINECPFSTYES